MVKIRHRTLFAVLKDAWPLLLLMGGVAVASCVAWSFATTLSAAIRYAGLILELLGLMTVVVGLSETRRLFGRAPLSARVMDRFRRLVGSFKRAEPIDLEASAGGMANAGGELSLIHSAGPDSSLERRLSILEEEVNRLRKEFGTKVDKLRQELIRVEATIDRERQERHDEDLKTAKKLEELAVGGFHLETVGLWWLVLGLVGAGDPDELSGWFAR
jgi:hypothetical protein